MEVEISIIVPFFNSESTINRTIKSVITQNFKDCELILVDDGSTDKSLIIAKQVNSGSVVSISQKNKGVSSARNAGAKLARGKWLIFLDSDDEFRPGFLNHVHLELKKNKKIEYLVFGINRIKNGMESIILPNDYEYFSKIPGTFVIRKSIFDQLGGYDEHLRFSENTELFHRIELINSNGKNVSWVSINYYDNPSGGSKNLQNMVDSLTIILEKHKDTLSTHVKHLYHQIIGVNQVRFRNFSQARFHLWKAIEYKPFKVATWGRFALVCFPFLAKRLYSEIVKHD